MHSSDSTWCMPTRHPHHVVRAHTRKRHIPRILKVHTLPTPRATMIRRVVAHVLAVPLTEAAIQRTAVTDVPYARHTRFLDSN